MKSQFRGLENVDVAGESLHHDQLAYLITVKARGGWSVDVWHMEADSDVTLVRISVSDKGYYSLCPLGRPLFAETGPYRQCEGRAGGLLVPDGAPRVGSCAIPGPEGFLYPQGPGIDRLVRLLCLEQDRLRASRYERRLVEQSLQTVFSGLGKGDKAQ